MSEYDDLTRGVEGIQYVGEDGTPEEGLKEKASDGPSLVTARDLLPPEDDPVAALPSEPPDEDTPPESATPPFIIMPRPGQVMPKIYLPDGEPLGVWLDERHHDLDGGRLAEMLVVMGLDGKFAAWYGIQRDARIVADRLLAEDPLVQSFAQAEAARVTDKKQIQDAFVKAHKERGAK